VKRLTEVSIEIVSISKTDVSSPSKARAPQVCGEKISGQRWEIQHRSLSNLFIKLHGVSYLPEDLLRLLVIIK
jgi:hypothetical protein